MNRKRTTKEWFKGWSNEYDRTLGRINRHHKMLDLAVKMSKVKNNEKILDIGCGTGLLSLKFLKKAHCFIEAADISGEMLSIFRKKVNRLGLRDKINFRVKEAEKMNFKNNTFDVVASTVTLHHVRDKYSTIKNIYNITKPGGRFVIGELDVDTSGSLSDVKRLRRIMDYLKEELSLALKEGGVNAFSRMYDNGKKHILNHGEYCVDLKKWARLCRKAGFENIEVKPVPTFRWMKVLKCTKPGRKRRQP
ncbi:MAG: methyltransferase domain-containing protein [Endomicrobiales bacterium]|nr:methyltransferase domain-containing protein [Endomicrobiales bacterium]